MSSQAASASRLWVRSRVTAGGVGEQSDALAFQRLAQAQDRRAAGRCRTSFGLYGGKFEAKQSAWWKSGGPGDGASAQ